MAATLSRAKLLQGVGSLSYNRLDVFLRSHDNLSAALGRMRLSRKTVDDVMTKVKNHHYQVKGSSQTDTEIELDSQSQRSQSLPLRASQTLLAVDAASKSRK